MTDFQLSRLHRGRLPLLSLAYLHTCNGNVTSTELPYNFQPSSDEIGQVFTKTGEKLCSVFSKAKK